jgi:flagellar basal-body rod protein FlgG
MVNALNTAASGMLAQMEQIEHLSNNLANVNTPGFKRTRAEFQDMLYETLQEPGAKTSALTQAPVGIQRGMGVKVAGTQRNFEAGTAQRTKRDLDFYIRGEGFFVVELPNGQMAYRRDGGFHRSPTGRVETSDGYPLQPELNIPSEVRSISVAENGAVNAITDTGQTVSLGQMQLATFVNQGGLKAIGKNLFTATEGSGQPALSIPLQEQAGGIVQFHLEASNVDMVREMTDMISAQRAFEMNSKVIQAVDQLLQHTVNVR